MIKLTQISKKIKGKIAREKGYNAEDKAVTFLKKRKYTIVERNFRPPKGIGFGEIDIIAKNKDWLIFVEVKCRDSFSSCAEAVTLQNKQRVTNSAEYFLAINEKFSTLNIRFDVLLVDTNGSIAHLQDAWRSNWF